MPSIIPTGGRGRGSYNIYYANAVGEALQRQCYRMSFEVANKAASALRAGLAGETNGVKAFSQVFADGLSKTGKSQLARIHKDVAAEMRGAVRNSYRQTVKSRPGQYRVGEPGPTVGGFLNRYSGGSLRNAVSSPKLAIGDADGIVFVDEGRLTKEAAHWYRLNFGARGTAVGGRKRTRYRVLLDGRVLTSVGFNVDSADPFVLPPGKFFEAGGGGVSGGSKGVPHSGGRRGMDAFFPGKGGPKPQGFTRGIQPHEFLDAGLRKLATELPRRYDLFIDAQYKKAQNAATSLPERVTVGPGGIPLGLKYRGQ